MMVKGTADESSEREANIPVILKRGGSVEELDEVGVDADGGGEDVG